MGLGGHLVTIQLLKHLKEPMWWPQGPCTLAPQKPQNCSCRGYLVAPENVQKFTFFPNPSVVLGMGLGDHLMAQKVFKHP